MKKKLEFCKHMKMSLLLSLPSLSANHASGSSLRLEYVAIRGRGVDEMDGRTHTTVNFISRGDFKKICQINPIPALDWFIVGAETRMTEGDRYP